MTSAKSANSEEKSRIFHVGSRETLQKLRDDILRIHGFEVESTLSYDFAMEAVLTAEYDLVLIDVEGENRVRQAERLCDDIRKALPHQHIAYVCNYRVAIESDCPDEIIRAEFDPEGLVRSVKQVLSDKPSSGSLSGHAASVD